MKRWFTFFALLTAMLLMLALSTQAAEAMRQGLALCARSVVPALFPFLVLSGLFVNLGCADVPARLLGSVMQRLFGCSGSGASAFFLGILGGYPLGARTIGELYRTGRISHQEGEDLLCFCNNTGPAFILGIAGAGIFGDLRLGAWLYLIHVAAATLVGLLLRRSKAAPTPRSALPQPSPSFPSALVSSITSAGTTMVQICAFVVFFYTLLHLSPLQHPVLLGVVELTRGITALTAGRDAFLIASALLGWGGISVHCQTAAVLADTPLSMRRYLLAKALHALIAAALAWSAAPLLF